MIKMPCRFLLAKKAQGFTILEALLLIIILALLAAIILPAYLEARKKGKEIRAPIDLKQLELGIEMYLQDNSVYPK